MLKAHRRQKILLTRIPPISLITTERIDIGKSRPQQWATSDLGGLPRLSNGGWLGEAPLAAVGVVAVQRAGTGRETARTSYPRPNSLIWSRRGRHSQSDRPQPDKESCVHVHPRGLDKVDGRPGCLFTRSTPSRR